MISFTRKPRLVSSSITWRHCPESSLRWASFSGVAVIFSTMKSRVVTSDENHAVAILHYQVVAEALSHIAKHIHNAFQLFYFVILLSSSAR